MAEDWKVIKGFPNYWVSSKGVVVSNRCTLIPVRDGKARKYLRVRLVHRGQGRMKYVHRLVAQAFIPNSENKPTVNHEDGDTLNNSVANLSWATHKEQIHHAIEHGLIVLSPQGLGGRNCFIGRIA